MQGRGKCNKRASNKGFLPNTRSRVERWIEKARWMLAQLALRIKRKRKRKVELGMRLGKLSGRKDYRKVLV